MKSAGVDVKNEKKVNTSLMETQLRVDKMLRSMRKYGILRVSPYSFEKKFGEAEVLLKLSKKILWLWSQGFLYGESQKKLWWLDSYQQIDR